MILKYHEIELHFDSKAPHGLYLIYSDDEIELSLSLIHISESIVPILWSQELQNIWVYAFWTEPSVHLIHQLWEMPNPYIPVSYTHLKSGLP